MVYFVFCSKIFTFFVLIFKFTSLAIVDFNLFLLQSTNSGA